MRASASNWFIVAQVLLLPLIPYAEGDKKPSAEGQSARQGHLLNSSSQLDRAVSWIEPSAE
jgi:hypothetical protein